MKAKRVCAGYKDETDLIFRRYGVREEAIPISQSPLEELETWQSLSSPIDKRPYSVDDTWTEQFALIEFFNDYCIIPKATWLTRGYLAGLETLLASAGPSSDVAVAAKTAAFASLANKHHDTHLSQRAKTEYSKLLMSFSTTMSKPETTNTLESLTTAILLGIYEVWFSRNCWYKIYQLTEVQIISASKGHPGEHEAHFRGVAAILSSKSPVFSQHPVTQFWPEQNTNSHHYDKTPLIVCLLQ